MLNELDDSVESGVLIESLIAWIKCEDFHEVVVVLMLRLILLGIVELALPTRRKFALFKRARDMGLLIRLYHFFLCLDLSLFRHRSNCMLELPRARIRSIPALPLTKAWGLVDIVVRNGVVIGLGNRFIDGREFLLDLLGIVLLLGWGKLTKLGGVLD